METAPEKLQVPEGNSSADTGNTTQVDYLAWLEKVEESATLNRKKWNSQGLLTVTRCNQEELYDQVVLV